MPTHPWELEFPRSAIREELRTEINFDLAAVRQQLVSALAEVRSKPSFENARNVCECSRFAFGVYYTRHGLAPQTANPEDTEHLKKSLRSGVEAIGRVRKLAGPLDLGREKTEQLEAFQNNIQSRLDLLLELHQYGPESVHKTLTSRYLRAN